VVMCVGGAGSSCATDFGTLGAEVSALGVGGTEDTEIARPISVARGGGKRRPPQSPVVTAPPPPHRRRGSISEDASQFEVMSE
jgi:hypothetical protein